MRSLVSAAAVAAAVVLTATGCAGAGATGASNLGGAASLVPSGAVAFVAVDTDMSSGQWSAVDGLLSKFPARDALLAKLQQAFEKKTKLSWADDVQPALGPEVDLVALPGSPPQFVALTQPSDRAKLTALLAKVGGGLESRQVGGWTAISKSADALGTLEHVTAPLADATAYQDAMSKLDGDALVRAYADGARTEQLLAALPGQVIATTPPQRARFGSGGTIHTFATEQFAWGAADVVAEHDGLRVRAFTRATPATLDEIQHARLLLLRTDAYAPLLVDEIPAGALLVADYQAVPGAFENVDLATLPPWVKQLYEQSPNLPNDLDNLLGGETAIYVSPGLPMPAVTLVTQPAAVDRAVAILPEVVSELTKAVPMLGQLSLQHAVIGGQLVISTSQRGIADFRAPGQRLSDDPAFQEATKAAGMPAQTTGFVYANLADVLPLVTALAPGLKLGDVSALRSLVAFGEHTGADSSYTLFVEVK